MTTATTSLTELDQRTADGIAVTLLWDADADRVVVRVVDEGIGETFEVQIAKHLALDAFHHPYAYAARERALDEFLNEAYAA